MALLNTYNEASGSKRFMPLVLAIVVLTLLVLSLNAQAAQKSSEGHQIHSEDGKTWTVNIHNADIQAFISQIAQMTGKNFVIDPRVRAKDVTVISNTPLTSDEVYQLFLSVLQVHGYAAVPAGDVIKIVTNTTAKQSNLPFTTRNKGGEQLVTEVISVANTPVEELVPVLRPLVPQYGHLAAVGSANALIISDHADNVRRIRAIVHQLDQSDNDGIQIVSLRHAYAGNMVQLLQELTKPDTSGRRKGAQNNVTVVADERTNRIILKGDHNIRARLIPLIHRLDTPSAAAGGVSVIRLSHGDAEDMAKLLEDFAAGASSVREGSSKAGVRSVSTSVSDGRVSIQADKSLNALVIRAEPEMMKQLQSVISQLDVRRAQILIEAAIVEISGDKASQLGFQYVAGSLENGIGAVNYSNNGVSVGSLLQAVISGDASNISLGDGLTAGIGETDGDGNLQWGALIQALASTTNTNLLSTPSILTLDNQEASIIVGENVPFVTGTSTSTGSGVSNPFQTIERQDVGLSLKVTPHVADPHSVRLELDQETSAVKDSATPGASDIVTTKRELKTTVLADDGKTIVLGGLISDDVQETVSKIPLLGDIPILGVLFRSTSHKHEKRNLMVFIRPTILSDNQRLVSLTKEKYMGVTAMQFSVDEDGNLVRDVDYPMPTQVDQLFNGRTQLSDKFRQGYYKEQHKTPEQSAAPTASGPTINPGN